MALLRNRRLNGGLYQLTLPPAGTPPSQIGNLTVGTPGPTTIPVSYTAATGTAPITYTGYTAPHGTASWTLNGGSFSSTGGTLIGLASSTDYNVQIIASNAAGSSTFEYFAGVTTAAGSATPPSQVGALTVGTPGITTIPVSYTAATGTAPITYQGCVAAHGSTSWTLNSGTFLSTGGTLIGLMGGTNYDVQIVATNTAGSSTTQDTAGVTTATYTAPPSSTSATRHDIYGSASSVAVGTPVTLTLPANGTWNGEILTPSVVQGNGTLSPTSITTTSGSSTPATFTYTPSATGEHYIAVANSGSLHTPYHAPLNVYAASSGTAQTLSASILSGIDLQCHQFDTLAGVAAGFSFTGAKGWGEVWINLSAIGGASGGLFVKLYDALSSGASTTVGTGTALQASPVQVYGAVSATGTVRLLLPASPSIYFMDLATDAAFTHPVRLAQRFSVGLVMGCYTRSFECGIGRVYAESQTTPIGSFGAPLTTTEKLAGDERYNDNASDPFYRQDGGTGDPTDTSQSWVPSTGAMEAGRIVAAQMGVTLSLVGCLATGGGLDQFVNHDGSLNGGFTGSIPNSAPGNKFRWFWGAWNGWDGVSGTYPTETLAESTLRLQAAPGWIMSTYPACAIVGICCASGHYGNYGSNTAPNSDNTTIGYTRLQSVVQAMEDSNPAIVSKGNYAWNEYDGGHATNGSKRLYADTGIWQMLSAELTEFGGLQTANRGPRLATTGTYISGGAVIRIPYTLHGGTTLTTCNILQSNPTFTVTTGEATATNMMSLFAVFPAGGTGGTATPLVLSSVAIDTVNSDMVLTLTSAPSGNLTVQFAADFELSGGDGDAAAGHVCMITDNQTGPASIPFGRWMVPQLDIVVAEVSASNPTPPAITGITFTQPAPIPATLNDGNALHFIAAVFAPVGGTGPFTYTLSNPSGSFATIDETARGNTTRGWIADPSYSSQSASMTLSIADSTGATATDAVTIDTSLGSGPTILVAANRTWPANENPYNLNTQIVLWNSNAVDTTTAVTITDTTNSGYFASSGRNINLPLVAHFPPVGSYPLVISAAGYPSVDVTIQIVAAAAGTPYFLRTVETISTSILAGTVIGSIIGTSPNNVFTSTLTDTTGTLELYGNNVVIATPPTSSGTIPFTFTITDKGGSTTASCSANGSAVLNVVQGTTLPSTNMSFAGLTTTFTNDTFNNIIGTIPTPTGVTGTPQWTLVSQSNLNPYCVNSAVFGTPTSEFGTLAARYQLSSGGALTAPAILSAGMGSTSNSATDTLVISCTDGINTCTADLSITVNWASVSETYYVGEGMSTTYGANGFEHFVGLLAAICDNASPPHTGTFQVYIYANANPDYYANDTGTLTSNYALRFDIPGPIVITGVAAGGISQPRLGGVSANNVSGGSNMAGKGFLTIGHGDCIISNIEGSGNHGSSPSGGIPFITKDGMTYGNLSLINSVLHDNDVHLLSGYIHGQFWIENNEFGNHGTEHSGSGPLHGIYLDGHTGATISGNVFRRGTFGHMIKNRGTNVTISSNRIFDGISGSASAMIDCCDGGLISITGNVIVKGPMGLNPNVIQYGEEALDYNAPFPLWQENVLTVSGNTIDVLYMTGAHEGGPNILDFVHFPNANGVQATGTFENNSIWAYPGTVTVVDDTTTFGGSGAVVVSGNTTRTLPTTISTTRPYLSGTLPELGGLFYHTLYGQDDYVNFEGVYQYQDRDQIEVAHTAAAGTTLCAIYATNNLEAQGAGTANPFVAGTTWSIITTGIYYTNVNPSPWAAAGKYSVIANSDGSATLQVGGTALTSGVDYVQLRATAPNGTLCDNRYAITLT